MNTTVHMPTALIAATFVGGCIVADAESADDDRRSVADLEFKHCAIETSSRTADQADVRPASRAPECFRTFSQALQFATSGRVQLPLEAVLEDLDEAVGSLDAPGLDGTYVIGIEYDDANFRGSTKTYFGDTTCDGTERFVSWVGEEWNDRISSARAYSECNHSYHYEHINFGGAIMDCGSSCNYIGDALNDETSSIRWTN
ncbi:hypothetical protein [Chondromyces crocatus]|uniref:Uncharacterized protein n=1 Tax=Chondromyces crocatus TaxID=52 RepID=A0A0K1ECN0_CHOCO|nr:hypothetical protein [Chondromyces crocatus]AKT38338.1 uncharacterized protein CMC5_024830 [Chondromyces crocatus]